MSFRVTIVQPAMPNYRRAVFHRMAQKLGRGFAVYASEQQGLGVLSTGDEMPEWQRHLGEVRGVLAGLEWQKGACSVPVRRGDVLVICGAPRTLSTIVLLFKGKILGARTIWWGHYWSATSRPWRAAIRYALMRVPDAIIFYTDEEVSQYRDGRARSSTNKQVFGLNNGIETQEIVRLRSEYNATTRPCDLLFIGRITPKADLDILFDALCLPGCEKVTLDIVGSGEDEARLRKHTEDVGIADRVTWHGGTTDERRIALIANRCKVFVYPGSVGLSLIHALSYGLPVVVHNDRWTHMPEIAALRPGNNGLTFQRGSAISLADTIATLLADPVRLSVMSQSATDTTALTFNAADMAERFCYAIEQVAL